MRETKIHFTGHSVRGILDGSKTQTRRIIKPKKGGVIVGAGGPGVAMERISDREFSTVVPPYGQAGDRLWIKEGFSGPHYQSKSPPKSWNDCDPIWYWADGNPESGDWTRPKPSIYMPRWASRIDLEMTVVRVERLQDIGEADALAEGVIAGAGDFAGCYFCGDSMSGTTAKECYARLWESINGIGSWKANPWVWAISFKRVQP